MTCVCSDVVLLAELESLVDQLDKQEAVKQDAVQQAKEAEQQLQQLRQQMAETPQVSVAATTSFLLVKD